MAAFELQGQNCVLVTETIWPVKLDVFTVWLFADPWTRQFGERKKKRHLMCESCSSVFGSHHCRARWCYMGATRVLTVLGSRRSYFGGIKLQWFFLEFIVWIGEKWQRRLWQKGRCPGLCCLQSQCGALRTALSSAVTWVQWRREPWRVPITCLTWGRQQVVVFSSVSLLLLNVTRSRVLWGFHEMVC